MVIQKSIALLEPGLEKTRGATLEQSSTYFVSEDKGIDCQASFSSHSEEMPRVRGGLTRKSEKLAVEQSSSLAQDEKQTPKARSPNTRTHNSRRRGSRTRRGDQWSSHEKKDLKTYLRGKEHLPWAQIADGYRRGYGSRRRDASISFQAARLGFSFSEGAKRSKIVKLKILHRPLTSSNHDQTTEQYTAEPLQSEANLGAQDTCLPVFLESQDNSANLKPEQSEFCESAQVPGVAKEPKRVALDLLLN